MMSKPNDCALGRKALTSPKSRLLFISVSLFAATSAFTLVAASSAKSAQADHLDPVTHNPPRSSQVIRLFPGVAPGSEGATQVEVSDDGLRVRNVTVPELIVYKPKPGAPHTGAAMIVAPGGGGQHLSIINEGQAVAERLAASGVTGIVLKYRTSETPAVSKSNLGSNLAPGAGARDEFVRQPPRPAAGAPGGGEPAVGQARAPGRRNLGREDAEAAMLYVRAHASELGVSPDRVGFVGFSAGGSLAMALEVSPDKAIRPDFVGGIYSPGPPGPIPADAPPLFLAVADDDGLSAASLKTVQAWKEAKLPIELHLFNSGAHGFGMAGQGKTSDHWVDEFIWWLTAPGGQVKLATK